MSVAGRADLVRFADLAAFSGDERLYQQLLGLAYDEVLLTQPELHPYVPAPTEEQPAAIATPINTHGTQRPAGRRAMMDRSKREGDMADDLTVTREGDMLVIRLAIKTPTPSASGKTLVVASTRRNQKTGVQVEGKDLYLGVNAYVYAEPKGTK